MLVYHTVADSEHEHADKHAHGSEVEQVVTPSFFDLSARVTYSIPLGRHTALDVSAGVQNIFNSYQRDFDQGPDRDSQYIYGPSQPRTIFAEARLSL